MNLKPTGNRILVKPFPPADMSMGGIVIPEHWKQPSGHARVVAVGQQVQGITPGDTVMYSWINGKDVDWQGETYRLLYVNELLAIKSKEDA